MSIFEIILLGLALSMDAAAVSMTNGLLEPKMKIRKILLIALFFGFFQGIMPLIGYFAGSVFAELITEIAPWLALILLGFIGGKMIYEGASKKDGEENDDNLTIKKLFVQAIATSIDAFAVGISLLALDKSGTLECNIYISVTIIAITTFIISVISVFIGKKFGVILKSKAEIIGGIILVVIGLKIFLDGIL